MAHYLTLVEDCLAKLGEWVIERVPRTENLKVDVLVKIAITLPIKEVVLLAIYFYATSLITSASIYSTSESNTN